MKGNFCLFICFLISQISVISQNSFYKSKQIAIENGLAHNTVSCVFKDNEGVMWFGTHNGLNSYNGANIKTYQYNHADSNSISGNRVLTINQDSKGFLWVGTEGNGLSRLDKRTGKFKVYYGDGKTGLNSNEIVNIKTIDDLLWICTGDGVALYDSDNDKFINYRHPGVKYQKSTFYVFDILKITSDDFYLATNDNFLWKFNKKNSTYQKVSYERHENLKSNFRKRILEDNDGNLWISAFNHGLVKYNPNNGESVLFTEENSVKGVDLVNGPAISHENKIYFSTDGAGVIIYNVRSKSFSSIKYHKGNLNTLISNKITSLIIDDENILWISTFDEGVNVLNPNQLKFSNLKKKDGSDFSLIGLSVLSVFEDSKNNIWIGTDGNGLYKYEPDKTIKHFKHDPLNNTSISSDRIVCIEEDKAGNIMLGTYLGGLSIYDPLNETFTRYLPVANDKTTISSIHVWEIFVESETKIWVGMLGTGLDLFNPITKKFEHYGPYSNHQNKINHNNVLSIIKDRANDLWIATEGNGISILDKATNRMFHTIHTHLAIKPSNNSIRYLFEDKNGTIWIAAENGGLNRYDRQRESIKYYFKEDGLPSNIIYNIIEDDNNNLWLGTAYGLSKFNIEDETFTNYDIFDGLHGYVCNRDALFKRKDGSILVGTTNGLNIFHPKDMKKLSYTPGALFTGLRIQNKIVEIGDTINTRIVLNQDISYLDEIDIHPDDKIFTLEFTAKTYTLTEKCKYKYILEGFEKEWTTTEHPRQHATYSNLAPGKYVFKLKASNRDGVWSDKVTDLTINVLPSFWQSVWFKLIIAIGIVLLLYFGYRYQITRKKRQFYREKSLQEQKIIRLEKEKLESELNNKTFNILDRNKSLLNLKRRLELLLNRLDNKNQVVLNKIINEIDNEINEEKDWKHIEPRLDKVYNNFMTTLKRKHVDLTQSELRISAYVRMGLSTKEIADLLQKTVKAIENDRYRLRKKLDIPAKDSLKNYLLDL